MCKRMWSAVCRERATKNYIKHGRFPFNKNSGLKFRKFHMPNGTVHSGCTDSTQATARLVIILLSRFQKSGTGDNNFVKWKGTFRSNRTKWSVTGQSGPPSKLVPSIPVGPNRNSPFPLMYQPKFPEFWAKWKAPHESPTHEPTTSRTSFASTSFPGFSHLEQIAPCPIAKAIFS